MKPKRAKPKPSEPEPPEVKDGRFTERAPYVRVLSVDDFDLREIGDTMTLEFSASSEEPLERWWGTEILSHEPGAVNLLRAKRGAMPLLFNHDIDTPIGMVRSARLEKNRLMVEASMFTTPRAREVESMIEGGLRNVSIAYRIGEIVENLKEESFTVTDWEPYEVSIVSVPADASVGIGRQCEEYEVRMIRGLYSPAPIAANHKGEAMEKQEKNGNTATMPEPLPAIMSAEKKVEELKMKSALEIEESRRRAIQNFAKANRIADSMRDAWIEQGYSLEEVSKDLISTLEERGRTNPQPASRLGLSAKETEQFSIIRAIRGCALRTWQKDAPYELEVTKAVAQRLGKVADENKFYLPFEAMQRQWDSRAVAQLRQQLGLPSDQRDLTVASAGGGGYLVDTRNVGFIEMLYNRSVALRMGATRLTGLQGNVSIPRQSVAGTAYWLTNEATAITESQQTFVQVALTPKTVGGYTEISRLLLLQSSPGAEGIVTQDLANIIGVAADLGVINGSGGAQPAGIIGTSGIGGVTGTTLAYAGVLEFQTDVASANVVPLRGGYVTTPAVAGLLMARARFANSDTPLWVGNIWEGTMAGFPAMSSMQIPTADMLFGDWSEVVVAEWGTLEVEVNPYANFPAAIIGVRAIYTMDCGVRRPFAFSLATSIT